MRDPLRGHPRILYDADTFSNVGAFTMVNPVPDDVVLPPGSPYPSLGNTLDNSDDPEHARQRRLIAPAFARTRIAQYADQIRAVADELLDDVGDRGQMERVGAYANLVPIRSINLVLGFPADGAAKFRRWTDYFFELLGMPHLPPERARVLWEGVLDQERYIRHLVAERRRAAADDMISDLVRATDEDGGQRSPMTRSSRT